MIRRSIPLAALAIGLLLMQVAPAGAASGVRPGAPLTKPRTTIGFWAGEAVPGTDWDIPETYWARRDTHFFTPGLWRVLRRNHIPLYFNLRYQRDFGAVPPGEPDRHDALPIIRTANRLGVPVWGWVLIPYSDGYWAWEGAAAKQFQAVKSLVHWMRTKHVQLRGIALDPEPPLRTPFETTASIMGGGSDSAFASLFENAIDPTAQCLAWRAYERIPRWAEDHGVDVVAAPMPAALDDIQDGRLALQDAAQFLVPDAPWDRLYFQAYRSVFSYYSGHDPGPGIVSSYFRSARGAFGNVGQVSLGSAGRGPYRRFASLIHDVRLAATLGAANVPIYSLERTLRAYGGPHAVARLAAAANHPFAGPGRSRASAATPRAEAVRAAIRRSDTASVRATLAITASHGFPQRPNRWPTGCDG